MAERPEIPVDDLMGRPLYFAPSDALPRLPGPDEDYDRTIANFHHIIFERRRVEGLGPGGEAARDSGLQWSVYWQHVAGHKEWVGLTDHFPDTAEKQYDMIIPGIAGYVGEKAIGFVGSSPFVMNLNRSGIDRLRMGGTIILGNNGARVRRYLLDHSFDRGGQAVDVELARKFMRLAGNPDIRMNRKLVMANYILRQAIDPTISTSLRERYAYARRQDLLRPDVPKNLAELVRSQIQLGWPIPEDFVYEISGKCETLVQQREQARVVPKQRRRLVVAVQGQL